MRSEVGPTPEPARAAARSFVWRTGLEVFLRGKRFWTIAFISGAGLLALRAADLPFPSWGGPVLLLTCGAAMFLGCLSMVFRR